MDDREKAICARVRQFREQIKWPQPAFAYEIGVTRDQLASVEYGRTPLKYSLAYAVCYTFDVSEYWLATGRGPLTPYHRTGPSPGSLPEKSLFSEVFDRAMRTEAKLASDVTVPTKTGASKEIGDDVARLHKGNPSASLLSELARELETAEFSSRKEEETFCNYVAAAIREARMGLRRRRVRGRVRMTAANPTMIISPLDIDLSKATPDQVKRVLSLQTKIKRLEVDLITLQDEIPQ